MVVVTRTDEEAHRLTDDLAAWIGDAHVLTLAERAALPLERALPEHDESAERLAVLTDLASGRSSLVVVASLLSLAQRTLAPEQLAAGRISVRVGERISQRVLLERLVAGGYEPAVEVTGIGEFAHRGGLVDVWPPGAPEPPSVGALNDGFHIETFHLQDDLHRLLAWAHDHGVQLEKLQAGPTRLDDVFRSLDAA